jgi:hypothetical protein
MLIHPPPSRDVKRHARTAVSLCALLLFASTAAVVLWQNGRFTILWDVSYILENASRMAAGDVPYRDFAFPYAPLTFVVQAIIIKLFGRAFWHHIAYAAVVGGAASALTFAIVRHLLRLRPHATTTALLLCAPLVLLGNYCVFPHPFYDPDCCFVLLVVMALLLACERRDFPPALSFATGAAAVIPLFVKQNVGAIFGAAFAAAILLMWSRERVAARRRGIAFTIAGGALAMSVAVAVIAIVPGLGNYWHWTVRFAAARRLPPLLDQLSIYNDATLWWFVAAIATGAVMMRQTFSMPSSMPRRPRIVLQIAAMLLICAPWLWTVANFYDTDDPIEPQLDLLRFWPLALIALGVLIATAWRESTPVERLLPLLLLAAIHGSFLSQSTWGSTYGIWPLWVVAMALLLRHVTRTAVSAVAIAAVIALVMLHEGWPYILTSQRLTYAKVMEGQARRSSLPALRGLTERGQWLPDFEELVSFAGVHFSLGDAIFSFPGEDLFYFTTGRRPLVPVVMVDRTINPYSAAELAAVADTRRVRWVVIKKRLQLNGEPMPMLGELLQRLRAHYVHAAALRNYDIYRRVD